MKKYLIKPAIVADLPIIFQLFEEAIAFQRAHNYIGWQYMDKQFLENDVNNQLLFKITKEDQVYGLFCICLSDKLIWRERDNEDALYLHRIVLNQAFKGEKLFKIVFDWAVEYARNHSLSYLRMDTWAANEKLISYYLSYGFRFVEYYQTGNLPTLPVQHRNLDIALLEYLIL